MAESWPYVSKRLHLMWLPNDPPGWQVPAFWSLDGADPIICYRLTPTVYVWLCKTLSSAKGATDSAASEWNTITDWAATHFDRSEIAQARQLPRIELPQPVEDWRVIQVQDEAMSAAADSRVKLKQWSDRYGFSKEIHTC